MRDVDFSFQNIRNSISLPCGSRILISNGGLTLLCISNEKFDEDGFGKTLIISDKLVFSGSIDVIIPFIWSTTSKQLPNSRSQQL